MSAPRSRSRPARAVRIPALALIVLAVLGQLLAPTFHAWHLSAEAAEELPARIAAFAGAPAVGATSPCDSVLAHHHDESACALCQALAGANRALSEVPAPALVAFVEPCAWSEPLPENSATLATGDLGSRPPRGPPRA